MNALYFRFDQTLSQTSSDAKLFAIALNKNDRIRLINTSSEINNLVRSAILQAWPNGIEEENSKKNEHEFRLKGEPWCCLNEETIYSRRLVCYIFKSLSEYEYSLYGTCESSRQLNSKSLFFFRHEPKFTKNQSLCICLDGINVIRVIDGNENHVDAVRDAIIKGWNEGIENNGFYRDSYYFILKGLPFKGDSHNSIYMSTVLMKLLENFKNHKAQLLCSASVNGRYHEAKHSFKIDLSAWFVAF